MIQGKYYIIYFPQSYYLCEFAELLRNPLMELAMFLKQ